MHIKDNDVDGLGYRYAPTRYITIPRAAKVAAKKAKIKALIRGRRRVSGPWRPSSAPNIIRTKKRYLKWFRRVHPGAWTTVARMVARKRGRLGQWGGELGPVTLYGLGQDDSLVSEMEAELGLDGMEQDYEMEFNGLGGILDDVWGFVGKIKDKVITNVKDQVAARLGYKAASRGQAPALPQPSAPITIPPPMPPAIDIKKIAMIGVPAAVAAYFMLSR